MQDVQDRFLRLEDVINKTGLKRSTIYNLINKNAFPKSIAITSTSVAWLESEINQWIQEKVNQRNQKQKGA